VGISVIIPCYCCSETLPRAVDSIAAQTRLPEQVLLVDDASPDDGATIGVMEQLRQKYPALRIEIIDLKTNVGPGEARNAGWGHASQEYLAFLDADDAWFPDKLRLQYEWMSAHPEATMSGHRSVQIRTMSNMPPQQDRYATQRVSLLTLLFLNRFPTRSVMLRRSLTLRFESQKRYAEDFLLWLRIACAGHAMWFLDAPLACSFKADYGESGLTASLWRMERGELDSYIRLSRSGDLSYPALAVLLPWSLFKFLIRLIKQIKLTVSHD